MTSNKTSADSQSIEVLNELLVLCADGVEGYRRAAAAVADAELHRRLAKKAAEREEVVFMLTTALVALNNKPTHHGSLLGAAHRRWLDLLGFAAYAPSQRILEECARAEQITVAHFERALALPLPPLIHDIVRRQHDRVLASAEATANLSARAISKSSTL